MGTYVMNKIQEKMSILHYIDRLAREKNVQLLKQIKIYAVIIIINAAVYEQLIAKYSNLFCKLLLSSQLCIEKKFCLPTHFFQKIVNALF